jgi:hypothetical protein
LSFFDNLDVLVVWKAFLIDTLIIMPSIIIVIVFFSAFLFNSRPFFLKDIYLSSLFKQFHGFHREEYELQNGLFLLDILISSDKASRPIEIPLYLKSNAIDGYGIMIPIII